MNYQEFRCEFLERMKEVMEEGVNITTEQINKNNGIVMEGLMLRKENARVASVFYLEDYFKYWERGVPMEQLVRKVLWQFEHCKPKFDVAAEFFKNYEEAKENICFKLINYERNRELLKKVPHKRILDLAMVFYYRIRKEGKTEATILVENVHLDLWDITQEELEENAKRCTYLKLPVEFINMRGFLGLAQGKEKPMYILTNKERSLGAGTFLYPGVLKQAEELLGARFYVLPSSVHECILIPEEDGMTQEALTGLVTEINERVTVYVFIQGGQNRMQDERDTDSARISLASSTFEEENGETETARVIFPEYYDEAVENTPARITVSNIHGAGQKYRYCFEGRKFRFDRYDKMFVYEKAEESVLMASKIAVTRLQYPKGLWESAKKEYEKFLMENLYEVLLGTLEDPETIKWIAGQYLTPEKNPLTADKMSGLITEISKKHHIRGSKLWFNCNPENRTFP